MSWSLDNISFCKTGQGSPVVWLHGWGSSCGVWDGLISELGATCTCYAVDLPGFGRSFALQEAWTSEQFADCIAAWMERQGIRHPVLVGHSFGGKIALLLAARGCVRAVVLMGAAGIRPKRGWRWYVRVWPYKVFKWLAAFPLFSPLLNDVVVRMRASSGSADYRAASGPLRDTLVRVVNEDISGVLPSVRVPVLMLWGGQDTATPPEHAHRMKKLIPDATLHVYPEAGHYVFQDEAAACRDEIRRFLKRGEGS